MLASGASAGGTKISVPDKRASRIFRQVILVRKRKKPSSTIRMSFASCSGTKARKAPVFRDPLLSGGVIATGWLWPERQNRHALARGSGLVLRDNGLVGGRFSKDP